MNLFKPQEAGLKARTKASIIIKASIRLLTLLLLSFFILLPILLPSKGFPMDLPDITNITKEAKEKYENLKTSISNITLVQEATTVTDKENIISNIKSFKQGEKFRIEAVVTSKLNQGKKAITIYDGTDYWTISSGVKTKLSEEMKKKIQATNERKWWDFIPEGAEIKGSEKVDGFECYIIESSMIESNSSKAKMNSINNLWIDKEKLTLRKAEIIGTKGEVFLILISDFHTIKDNIEIPFKVTTYKDNKLLSTVITKSCEINNEGFSSKNFDAKEEKTIDIKEVIKELFD